MNLLDLVLTLELNQISILNRVDILAYNFELDILGIRAIESEPNAALTHLKTAKYTHNLTPKHNLVPISSE